MIYNQCLCCFRFHSEIWICFSNFEKNYDPSEAKKILNEGIEVNQNNLFLRVTLSEVDEALNKLDDAKKTLELAYENQRNGYSFSILQKFIRRYFGIIAARKLFSETAFVRKSNPFVGLEVDYLYI
jgi:hypothetical protein